MRCCSVCVDRCPWFEGLLLSNPMKLTSPQRKWYLETSLKTTSSLCTYCKSQYPLVSSISTGNLGYMLFCWYRITRESLLVMPRRTISCTTSRVALDAGHQADLGWRMGGKSNLKDQSEPILGFDDQCFGLPLPRSRYPRSRWIPESEVTLLAVWLWYIFF